MKKFVDYIKEYDDFVAFAGASADQIEEAEEELGLKFNKEYVKFLKECGAASVNGHEFLGICDSKRLNIIDATINARSKNKNLPTDIYLIEDTGIDKVLIWQNEKGELFQTVGKNEPERIGLSLCEYVGN